MPAGVVNKQLGAVSKRQTGGLTDDRQVVSPDVV